MPKNGKSVEGQRNGAVKNRTQVYNPTTGNFVKRDATTGKFIGVKSDGKAFKGVIKEKSITRVSVCLSKSVANKAERSVIRTLNNKAK